MIKIAIDSLVIAGVFMVGFFMGSAFTTSIINSVRKALKDK